MDKPTHDWLYSDATRFPSVRRSLQIRENTLAIIEGLRRETGLPPFPPDITRGPRPRLDYAHLHEHSRDPVRGEILDKVTHRERHRETHVHGCPLCNSRKWAYLKNHPEHVRPKDWWRSGDPRMATLDGKPRRWVDDGWERHNPSPEPGELDRTLEMVKARVPKRLMQGTWPLTDDEDPE